MNQNATSIRSRRNFLKTSSALIGATAVASLSSKALGQGGKQKSPNVIFVICDQMRADAMSSVGNPNARTPNLDSMAKDGVLFENCFSNNPVCIPSRMSMFSGRYPHQVNRLANIAGPVREKLSFENSLGSYFKEQGYSIGYIGKNHTYQKSALQQFDTSIIRDREKFRAYNKYVQPYWHCDTLWPREHCFPKKTTEDALSFISAQTAQQPFFMHVSYFDPHPPYMAPADVANTYAANDMTLPEQIDPNKLSSRLGKQQKALHYDRISDAELKSTTKYYHAAVEWGVDYQMGRLMAELKTRGLTENTIVVFTSDHGDFMGEYRMVRKGMFMYDALMHIPMIWYGPGYIKKGLRVSNLAQGLDIFPTLLDYAGGHCGAKLEGRSLRPFLQGKTIKEPDYAIVSTAGYSDLPENYFKNPEKPYDEKVEKPFHSRIEQLTWKPEQRMAMARTKDWKLILSESQPAELYYLNGGTTERENVIDDPRHAEIVKKLTAKIAEKWDAFS